MDVVSRDLRCPYALAWASMASNQAGEALLLMRDKRARLAHGSGRTVGAGGAAIGLGGSSGLEAIGATAKHMGRHREHPGWWNWLGPQEPALRWRQSQNQPCQTETAYASVW